MRNTAFGTWVLGFAALSAAALVSVGCSSSDTSGTSSSGTSGDSCFDYAAFDGTTPTVSFMTDVMPIFEQSCSLSTSCHGGESGAGARPYMGPMEENNMFVPPTAEQLQKIFDQNVSAPSAKDASLNIVEPGDPEKSFMMYKLDGDFSCGPVTCDVDNKCGTTMPQGNPKMPDDKLNIIRRWIAQGAKND